jgi:hypothetical protein
LGVGQLVIGNSSVLADKEFLNLSVTAHNWVDIVQVRPEELVEYFDTKKKEGFRWTRVGVFILYCALLSFSMKCRMQPLVFCVTIFVYELNRGQFFKVG